MTSRVRFFILNQNLFQVNYIFNEKTFKGIFIQGGTFERRKQMKNTVQSTLNGIGICRADYKMSVSFWKPDRKSEKGAKRFLKFNNYVDAFRAHSALEQTSSLPENTLFIPALEVFHRPSVILNEQQQIKRDEVYAVEAYKIFKKNCRLSLKEEKRLKKKKEKLYAKKLYNDFEKTFKYYIPL